MDGPHSQYIFIILLLQHSSHPSLQIERLTTTIAAGNGRVVVKDPAGWNLSGGYPAYNETDKYGPEAEYYMISVFHQLHCLVSLEPGIKFSLSAEFVFYLYFEVLYKIRSNYAPQITLKSEFEVLEKIRQRGNLTDKKHSDNPLHLHLNHCFDYLRQAIMCAGDTALEKAMVVDGRPIRSVDGWGVEHECRDYSSIFNFAAQHQGSNPTSRPTT